MTDLQRSQRFYEILFGVAPTKTRPGYVKFEPKDPSMNLTLNEVNEVKNVVATPAHYGIQVKTTQAVRAAIERLSNAGLQTSVEENTTCCYAVQDKVWVADPEGNQWEVFVVLDADAKQLMDEESECCEPQSVQAEASTTCC